MARGAGKGEAMGAKATLMQLLPQPQVNTDIVPHWFKPYTNHHY